jgi:hypothetical protein
MITTPLALADMNSNLGRALSLKWKDLTDKLVEEPQQKCDHARQLQMAVP